MFVFWLGLGPHLGSPKPGNVEGLDVVLCRLDSPNMAASVMIRRYQRWGWS